MNRAEWNFFEARERFERWEEHWTLVYDRLSEAVPALGVLTVFSQLFGANRVAVASLILEFITFGVWRLVARHRFRGMDRWLARLREETERLRERNQ